MAPRSAAASPGTCERCKSSRSTFGVTVCWLHPVPDSSLPVQQPHVLTFTVPPTRGRATTLFFRLFRPESNIRPKPLNSEVTHVSPTGLSEAGANAKTATPFPKGQRKTMYHTPVTRHPAADNSLLTPPAASCQPSSSFTPSKQGISYQFYKIILHRWSWTLL